MELSDLAAQMRAADPLADQKMELYFILMDMGRIEDAHRLRATMFGDDGHGPLDRRDDSDDASHVAWQAAKADLPNHRRKS